MISILIKRQILCLRFLLLLIFFAASVFLLFVFLFRALKSGDLYLRGFDFVKYAVELLFPFLSVLVVLLDSVVTFSGDYYQGTNIIFLSYGISRRSYLLAKVMIAWLKYALFVIVTSVMIFFLALYFDLGLSAYLIESTPQDFAFLTLRTALGFWIELRYLLFLVILAIAAAELAQGRIFLGVFSGFAIWLLLLILGMPPFDVLFKGPLMTLFHIGELGKRITSLITGELCYFAVCALALVVLDAYYRRKDIIWAVPVK